MTGAIFSVLALVQQNDTRLFLMGALVTFGLTAVSLMVFKKEK
jgi:hypothetical protein